MKNEFKIKTGNCKVCGIEITWKTMYKTYCNACYEKRKKEYHKDYYQKDKEKAKRESKKNYQENKQRNKQLMKDYWINNQEAITERKKKYYNIPENKRRIRKSRKEYSQRPEVKLRIKEYLQSQEVIIKRRKRCRDRKKTDPMYRLKALLRCRISEAINTYTKTGKIVTSKKYGIDYLAIIEYLKPFPKDMHLYHIDHIRPLCSFNFINNDGSTNLEEIQLAFAPENHQWLLAHDNLSKGGRWEKQSLLITQ